jgi:hypothetical protein
LAPPLRALVRAVAALDREEPLLEPPLDALLARGAEPLLERPLAAVLRDLPDEDLLVAIPHPSSCRELPPADPIPVVP